MRIMDKAELHRFLGEDVETYLGPIYESGSRYVVAVLGAAYGRKRWTLFEADTYKDACTALSVNLA